MLLAPFLFAAAWGTAPVAPAAFAPPAAATTTRYQIRVDGRRRYYNVHTPPGFDPAVPTPVVLVFHGGTGWAAQVETSSHFSLVADANGFVAVYPEGWALIPHLLQTWNAPLADDYGNTCGQATEYNIDDIAFVDRLLDDMATRQTLDQRRIFASGHSNGAMFCYRLAAELSDRIAAIAPNAGSRMYDPLPPVPIPVLHLHGQLDANVPWRGGQGDGLCDVFYPALFTETLAPIIELNGCQSPRLIEVRGNARYYEAPEPLRNATVALWWLTDGGHTWPGGEPALWNPDEPQNHDIVAAEEAWRFFAAHPMPE